MNVFVVLAHPEPLSFNGSMFRMAADVLMKAGHEVKASDLYAMQFDPVSGRHNFTTVKGPNYFRPQIEQMHATEAKGFAEDNGKRDTED
jgi:NAD(P)H dehydrogenase (quinone)